MRINTAVRLGGLTLALQVAILAGMPSGVERSAAQTAGPTQSPAPAADWIPMAPGQAPALFRAPGFGGPNPTAYKVLQAPDFTAHQVRFQQNANIAVLGIVDGMTLRAAQAIALQDVPARAFGIDPSRVTFGQPQPAELAGLPAQAMPLRIAPRQQTTTTTPGSCVAAFTYVPQPGAQNPEDLGMGVEFAACYAPGAGVVDARSIQAVLDQLQIFGFPG